MYEYIRYLIPNPFMLKCINAVWPYNFGIPLPSLPRSYEERGVEEEFLGKAKAAGWRWSEIPTDGNDYSCPEIHILEMRRGTAEEL